MGNKAYLVLENGKVFCGESFGAAGEVTAEVVFTTGMTGYLETLTDKSYFGQIVVQTFPLIGNYGVIPSDFEGKIIGPCGYIVKEWCQSPSNFRSEGDLDTTTERTHVDMDKIHSYRVTNAVESTSVTEMTRRENPEKTCTVALMDYGYKENIRRELEKRGAEVIVCPYNTTADELKALNIDGVMLSNGPGDPADNIEVIENLKKIMNMGKPLFGICLGHQLLALANGFKTEKLKYGHRGANQPVQNLETGRVYISSQNHGYAVVSSTIDPEVADEYFNNVNDRTCEGVRYKKIPAFSVQFHPEACGGPRDTAFLFDKFFEMMGK